MPSKLVSPGRHPASSPAPAAAGLARAEWLWALGLGASAVVLILWTLRADLGLAHQRSARNHLAYLAGQVSFALEHDAERGSAWQAQSLGPGTPPQGAAARTGRLAEVLLEGAFVPIDPWGGAYLLERGEDGLWRLASGGPSGRIVLPLDDGHELVYTVMPIAP